MPDEKPDPLADPVVQGHFSKLQAKMDKQVAELRKQNQALQADIDRILVLGDDGDGEDVPKLSKKLAALKASRVKEQSSREVSEAQQVASLATKAKELVVKFKSYGVHMEDLMEHESEADMLAYCLEQGSKALTEKKPEPQDKDDKGRVYVNPASPAQNPNLSWSEKASLGLKERGILK